MRAEALGLDPYDALMEQYDPGHRAADIAPLFAELKAFLVGFVPVALAAQEERLAKAPLRPLSGVYPIDRQRELGLAMMGAVGFDFTRGSLSISHHPFCGGVPSDVRITTRYRTTDFLSSLMGVLHETGHALYEQNLPARGRTGRSARRAAWPCTKARACSSRSSSAATRPSGTGRCRWSSARSARAWTVDDILPHVHRVERGLIRVDADEVTYPLHVILRFELERALVAGRLAPADIPEAWDAAMRETLGLSTVDVPKDGPMQDVHWPSGTFGYFPSYTLGAMMAAQQWAALARAHPSGRRRPARRPVRGGERLAPRKHLVGRLVPLDAGDHGARHRREARRRPLHRASRGALRRRLTGAIRRRRERPGRRPRTAAWPAGHRCRPWSPGCDGCLPRRSGPPP